MRHSSYDVQKVVMRHSSYDVQQLIKMPSTVYAP